MGKGDLDGVTPERYARAVEIFAAARTMPPDQRADFVSRETGPDAPLHALVESLLSHDTPGDSFLAHPPALTTLGAALEQAVSEAATAGKPDKIGPYRITGVLGSGGMGVVYAAEQESPHRRVAVKVLRGWFGVGPAETHRFTREAELLGRLDHPGVAPVYEAGEAKVFYGHTPVETVRFIAMGLVPGAVTVTAYAREQKLDVRERLKLMAGVCDAVHAAHQRGVIHRDLKPGNILVGDDGQAKVIDFGIGRGIGEGTAAGGSATGPGTVLGTLAYMSPEQAGSAGADTAAAVDTRSDVFSLGVVLFELLTETLPRDVEGTPIVEALKIIAESEPARLRARKPGVAPEVDLIVARALAKDKEQRYPSAEALAADLRRYLADEPIQAHPPTTVYLLKKFARRHRGLVGASTAALLVLMLGLGGTTWGMVRAREAEQEQGRLAAAEKAAKEEAQREVNTVTEVLRFIEYDVFQMAVGPDYRVRQMAEDAGKRLTGKFSDPMVEGMLHQAFGKLFGQLRDLQSAESHFRAAVALYEKASRNDARETWLARMNLAMILVQQRNPEAGAALEKSYHALRRLLGESNVETMMAASNLVMHYLMNQDPIKAKEVLTDLLAAQRQTIGERDPHYIYNLGLLASALDDLQDDTGAESAYVAAVTAYDNSNLSKGHMRRLAVLHNYAQFLRRTGRPAEAETILREVVRLRQETLPADHPYTIESKAALAKCLEEQNKAPEATEPP